MVALFRASHIGVNKNGLAPVCGNSLGNGKPALLVAARYRHLCALSGKKNCRCFTDPRRTACDQRGFVFQSHGSYPDPAKPPPSTTKAAPVTNDDESLARYRAACAISCGLPTRPRGRLADSDRNLSSGSPSCRASLRNIAVSVSPGQIQFT